MCVCVEEVCYESIKIKPYLQKDRNNQEYYNDVNQNTHLGIQSRFSRVFSIAQSTFEIALLMFSSFSEFTLTIIFQLMERENISKN